MATLNDEWLWRQKIKKWVSDFNIVKGKKEEWQKVYNAYLKSDVWKEKKKPILKRAGGICENCGKFIIDPDVHHMDYTRVGGNETEEDLKVLCYPCHQIADKKRGKQSERRRKNALYEARLEGFRNRQSDKWLYEHDDEELEIKFITYLYEQHCEEIGIDFDPNLDPETDLDFLEFWDTVLDGRD